MTVISRIGSALLLLAVVLPATTAHSINKPEVSCGDNKFFYKWKKTCVPFGGRPERPSPPKGSDCPPLKWYWGAHEGCCVPEEPEKDEEPEPQCRRGWKWLGGEHRCCEDDTPKPPSPQPSGKPDGPKNGPGHGPGPHKRSNKSRAASLCPSGTEACPISHLSSDYECMDTAVELESCGGCVALGKGQDCTAIKGAWNVGCVNSKCEVYTCAPGFLLAADGKSCIAH